jgi:hypothetical protein
MQQETEKGENHAYVLTTLHFTIQNLIGPNFGGPNFSGQNFIGQTF